MWKLYPPFKFFATPLPALVVGEENLVISFAPPPPPPHADFGYSGRLAY